MKKVRRRICISTNNYFIAFCVLFLFASILLNGIGCTYAPTGNGPNKKSVHVDPFTGMEFVLVKGGTYEMGDIFGDGFPWEQPVHTVTVSDFYIGKYEVTQEQWEKVMGSNPSHFRGDGRLPVEMVSWIDIQEFIKKLNEKSGENYRLPTEAEWEYAARSGGKKEKWAGTSNELEVGDYTWYIGNSGRKSYPVGTKKPNGLGIYDMSGSLWEWVQDWDGTFPKEPQIDPKGPPSDDKYGYRVYRGGAWDYIPRIVRVFMRSGNTPDYARQWIGFRLAKPVN